MPTLSRLAAASILFAITTPAFAAFSDVAPSHPNATAIQYLQENKIVGGYPDGSFRPEAPVNRAEFVKILLGSKHSYDEIQACIEDPLDDERLFTDVPFGAWYEIYVCFAKYSSLVGGYPDGSFRPEANISFAEAAKIIALAFELPVTEGNVWYRGYIEALAEKNAIPKTIKRYEQQITRGEMAEMIWRLDAEKNNFPSQTYETLNAAGIINSTSPIEILKGPLPKHEPYYATIDPEVLGRGVDGIDCQPALFDPATSKLYKDPDFDTGYRFWLNEGGTVFINGSYDGEDTETYLSAPFSLTYYYVACGSEIDSYILEIKKDGLRHALYTHVLVWEISPDQKSIFLVNYVQATDGEWQLMKRIITIETKNASTLPDTDCTTKRWGKWHGNELVTYGGLGTFEPPEVYTPRSSASCVWSATGKLQAVVQTNLSWGCFNDCVSYDQIGVLPGDPDTFYVLHSNDTDNEFTLQLQDLTNQKRYKKLTLKPKDLMIGYIEFDTSTSFDSAKIRYRFTDPHEGITSPWQTYP